MSTHNAFARRFPESTRTVMILEALIPGIEPWLDIDLDVRLWHGEFHMIPGLPEALVTDRQAVYFRYFFDVGTKDKQRHQRFRRRARFRAVASAAG